MKKEIKANNTFEKIAVTREQALKDAQSGRLGGLSERPGNPSKFKLGNLRTFPKASKSPISRTAISLTSAPGRMSAHRNIGAYKLTHVASAYIRRRKKSAAPAHLRHRLQEQDRAGAYFKMLEEAKRRDHRKIGAEMGLFCHRHRIRRARHAVVAAEGHRARRGIGKTGQETEFAAVTCASRPRIWRGRKCTPLLAICRITRRACFRRWSYRLKAN